MTKKRPKDINQIAASIVDRIANPIQQPTPEEEQAQLHSQAAAMLGRLGGLKGGPARAAKLSKKRRQEIARAAIKARWAQAKKK